MKIRALRGLSTTLLVAIVLLLTASAPHDAKGVEDSDSKPSSSDSKPGSSDSKPDSATTNGSGSKVTHASKKIKSRLKGGKQVTANEALPQVLKQQADYWNNGDLDGFMQSYLDSPKISYTSSGETVHGYEALKKRYVDKYGSKKDTMGQLSFSDLAITELGANDALCVGSWHLERANQPTLDGVFTLIFTKSNEEWKIIHDHTSAKVPKEPKK